MEKLHQLFNQYSNSGEYNELGNMPEVEQSANDLEEILKGYMTKEEFLEGEYLVTALLSNAERQGWIYGFAYAMSLLECKNALQKVGDTL